ncbi:hypothetical protein FIBSPDRAFT_106888 [Athelia psychrophila]|uniref:Uncharacterized protein n=1 Tax=Athelia psychrophila TaxID=1759441 RepID=A0A166D5X7_9AGAM|nr:hypothetical protein FIBSPDRAFT_106888 [Fibularhizoctonia sp. CBS 109695]
MQRYSLHPFQPPRTSSHTRHPGTRPIAFSRAHPGPTALRPQPCQRPSPTSLNRMWGCSIGVSSPSRPTHDHATSITRSIAFSRAHPGPTALRPPPPCQRPSPTSPNRTWGCLTDVFSMSRATHRRAFPRTRSIAFSRAHQRPTALPPQPGQHPSPTSLNRMWGIPADVLSTSRATHGCVLPRPRSIAFSRAHHCRTALRPQPCQRPTPTHSQRMLGYCGYAIQLTPATQDRRTPESRGVSVSGGQQHSSSSHRSFGPKPPPCTPSKHPAPSTTLPHPSASSPRAQSRTRSPRALTSPSHS